MERKRQMKKLFGIMFCLVLDFALFAGCGGQSKPADTGGSGSGSEGEAMGPSVNLSFAIYLPDFDATTKDCVRYLEMIKEATEGTVDFTLYAGGTLCAAHEELDAVRKGLADVTFFPVAYGPGSLVESFMLEYPGVNFVNGKAASYTVNEWFNQVKPKEIADLKLLFALGQGNGCIMTTFPVEKFEDLAGRQIRCGDSQAPIIKAYGATPTVMAFSEVYEALRTGIVEGFYGLAHAGNSVKLYEVTEYVVKDPFYFGTYIMVMNQDVWNSLSEAQQKAITETTEKAFDEFLAAGRDADAEVAYKSFEDNGLKVIEFDQANLDKMIGASGVLQKNYAKELDSKGYNGTKNLELFFELAEKYNKQFGGQ
ncbi:MAG: TRAP transporter substrate-binding protein DctP [Peptococcaceae bacterium]|nr:TRAP transporter substrate-binding protein DctP [Peptococcaceae bacterium]